MKTRNIKILEGHLTATDKKAINALLDAGALVGKVGKKTFCITEKDGIYHATYHVKDRGLMPVPGSTLRISTYKATFKID